MRLLNVPNTAFFATPLAVYAFCVRENIHNLSNIHQFLGSLNYV